VGVGVASGGAPVDGLGEDLGYLDEVGESDRLPVGPRRPYAVCVDERELSRDIAEAEREGFRPTSDLTATALVTGTADLLPGVTAGVTAARVRRTTTRAGP
jgi:hypothetical protein